MGAVGVEEGGFFAEEAGGFDGGTGEGDLEGEGVEFDCFCYVAIQSAHFPNIVYYGDSERRNRRTLCLAGIVRGLLHGGVGLLAHLLDLGAALGVGGQGWGRDGIWEGEEGAVQGVEV